MAKLLTTKQAAQHLGVSAAFLERDRWAGARIPFIKLGTRSVRYRSEDLEDYINRQMRHSTTENAA
ncbi:AlpA family transcriptional regulator [Marinimicrobium koreense]|uniref:AlpA family transcriptional regulator n=1 Tax=Marinimicrobium koreense TaxID=306545 RepID=A0A3N1NZG6_9GAMM|nr:helix-turn-helix domain-containing protein [Marinimicrobium koreense]ROQ19810.1 AlpA family transcriptional regulator [Marinimicrobium koreense]